MRRERSEQDRIKERIKTIAAHKYPFNCRHDCDDEMVCKKCGEQCVRFHNPLLNLPHRIAL